jgi:hypothetical protein
MEPITGIFVLIAALVFLPRWSSSTSLPCASATIAGRGSRPRRRAGSARVAEEAAPRSAVSRRTTTAIGDDGDRAPHASVGKPRLCRWSRGRSRADRTHAAADRGAKSRNCERHRRCNVGAQCLRRGFPGPGSCGVARGPRQRPPAPPEMPGHRPARIRPDAGSRRERSFGREGGVC